MTNSNLSRRTLAAGVAWTVPAVAAASAVPAFAASPVPGLNGWVTIYREYSFRRGSCTVVYDGRGEGNGPDGYPYGMYVWDVDSADKITDNPTLTIHLPYQVSWEIASGSSGWSLTNTGRRGRDYSYTFEYTGAYRAGTLNGKPTQFLIGRPHFRGSLAGSCPSDNTQTITRCAKVQNVDLCFDRTVPFPGTHQVRNFQNDEVRPMRRMNVEEQGLEVQADNAEAHDVTADQDWTSDSADC